MAASSSTDKHHSSVSFPASDLSSAPQAAPLPRPFRRISLPTAPTLLHRQSVASVTSFESLPDGQYPSPGLNASHYNLSQVRRPRLSTHSNALPPESPRRRLKRPISHVNASNHEKILKRGKIINEFYTTEKAYLDGLDLIYSHFLTPIITSLEAQHPLLDHISLTAIFSNFVDIWNLHRSFFSALAGHLEKENGITKPISPLLLSHFPYLSLYNPFITSFPSMISTLTEMTTPPTALRPNSRYNQDFATFLKAQESHPKCGKLKLRDWLLTIVQRCPRYLLLLKDLIKHTDEDDPEHDQLIAAHTLVSKITSTLNSSLQTHNQILSLLALQRSTTGLPFQLIEPGRILVKRGTLSQLERSSSPREREFLLFSDCLIWLASEESERIWGLGWSSNVIGNSHANTSNPSTPLRPLLTRSRSKSEAQLPSPKDSSPPGVMHKVHPPSPRRTGSTGEEKWIFKGQLSLVDLEATVPPRGSGEECRFEILSPEGSFALYAASEEEQQAWITEIRQTKAQLLASLNVMNPNSTLTSSASTNHVRRSLYALPFPPSDDRIATLRVIRSAGEAESEPTIEHSNKKAPVERRKKVEHWIPAVWIPDEKVDSCMRCARPFNWRRRRHHCRLCGRCVCSACSNRTFYIAEPKSKDGSSKAARACEVCYETVFPVVEPIPSQLTSSSPLSATNEPSNDTITSLKNLPSWVPMPAPSRQPRLQPQALMVDLEVDPEPDHGESGPRGPSQRHVRLRALSRPKSYHQILEDFQQWERGRRPGNNRIERDHLATSALLDTPIEEAENPDEGNVAEGLVQAPVSDLPNHQFRLPSPSPRRRKREDTEKRNKRFSLPAIALQTTNVTARSMSDANVLPSSISVGHNSNANLGAAARRFSLLLTGRNSRSDTQSNEESAVHELSKGVAASKLNQILGRK